MTSSYSAQSTIIKDETPLTEAFIPDRMYARDSQRDMMTKCLKPAETGRTPRNLFLFGPTGCGKTSLSNWVLDELAKYSQNVCTTYVNCWKNPSMHAILSKIVSDLPLKFSNPKKQSSELLLDIETYVANHSKKIIVVLDEVDRVEDMDVLYSLSRNGYGVVCISNDPHALVSIDPRIKSSFSPETLEFPKYTRDEMIEILRDRAGLAFISGAIDDVFIRIAAVGADGDARVGIGILRKAALSSEAEGIRKIAKEHLLRAQKDARSLKAEQILAILTEHHRALYNIIREKGKISSPELFEEYKKTAVKPISERTYRVYMEKLVTRRLVSMSGDVRWREYSTL